MLFRVYIYEKEVEKRKSPMMGLLKIVVLHEENIHGVL